MFTYTTHTFNEMFPALVRDVMNAGAEVPSRVSPTLELHPAIIEVRNPSNHLVTSQGRPVNVAFALAEVIWILGGNDDVETVEFYNSRIKDYSDDGLFFNAAYGHRLRHAFGVDQLDQVERILREDPGSRQASLVLSHPVKDAGYVYDEEANEDGSGGWVKHETKDRACNVYAHLMIRDGRLDWLQVIRSNDLMWGTPYNWMQFSHLQRWLAMRLDVPVGKYVHVADSLHVYDYHFEEAARIKPFDLYHELRWQHKTMKDTPIRQLLNWELMVREGSRNMAVHDSYWDDVLRVLTAHAMYKDHEDDAAFDMLLEGDQVYAAAQMRFYFANRWKGSEHFTSRVKKVYEDNIVEWMVNS